MSGLAHPPSRRLLVVGSVWGLISGLYFLGGAGLQLEQPLEVVAVVMRADGAGDRAADLWETRKPGWWASQEFLR